MQPQVEGGFQTGTLPENDRSSDSHSEASLWDLSVQDDILADQIVDIQAHMTEDIRVREMWSKFLMPRCS